MKKTERPIELKCISLSISSKFTVSFRWNFCESSWSRLADGCDVNVGCSGKDCDMAWKKGWAWSREMLNG